MLDPTWCVAKFQLEQFHKTGIRQNQHILNSVNIQIQGNFGIKMVQTSVNWGAEKLMTQKLDKINNQECFTHNNFFVCVYKMVSKSETIKTGNKHSF